MNTAKYRNFALGLLVVTLASCTTYDDLVNENTPEPPPDPSPGAVNFTKFVVLGNSLSAGFMDAALYNNGQSASYPAILSKQFALAGGGAFFQPDINSANGYNPLLSTDNVILGRLTLNATTDPPSFVPLPGEVMTDYAGDRGSLNNFGVPGARVLDAVVAGYGSFNRYFERFQSSASASMLGDAVTANGTFFSLWLGSNDVLGYATSGGTDPGQMNPSVVPPDSIVVGMGPTGPVWAPNCVPGSDPCIPLKLVPGITDYYATNAPASTSGQGANPSEITDPAVFAAAYQQVISGMAGGGNSSGGVALNITDVAGAPFFTTVPAAALMLPFDLGDSIDLPPELGGAKTSLATAINSIYAQFGFATDPTSGLPIVQVFDASPNNFFAIEAKDDNGNRVFRQLGADEVVLLTVPTDSLLAGWGTLKGLVLTSDGQIDLENTVISELRPFPIPSEHILDVVELASVSTRIDEFNQAIKAAVDQQANVALVDAHAIFETIKLTGYAPGSLPLSPDFGLAGMFSVDAIHTNARGNAIIANEVIQVINQEFGATVPLADPWEYSGNDITIF